MREEAVPPGAAAPGGAAAVVTRMTLRGLISASERTSWLLLSPLVLILAFFLVLPILTIAVVSFSADATGLVCVRLTLHHQR